MDAISERNCRRLQTGMSRHGSGRNPAALAQYHAADGVVESPMYQTRRGRAAIEEAYRAFFTSFPDATRKSRPWSSTRRAWRCSRSSTRPT